MRRCDRRRASRRGWSGSPRSGRDRPPRGRRGRASPASRGQDNDPLLPGVDRTLQLGLVHLRPAFDVHALGLVVELLLRAAPRPAPAGAQTASATRGDISPRRPRRLAGLAATRAFLVDRPRGDLLGPLGRAALPLLAFLDVLVLAFALVAP